MPLSSTHDPHAPRGGFGRWRRWTWIGAASLVIHLLLLDALPRFVIEPSADEPVLEPLRARLMPPIEPAASSPAPVAPPAANVPTKPSTKRTPTTRPTSSPPRPARAPATDEPIAAHGFDPVPALQEQPTIAAPAVPPPAPTLPTAPELPVAPPPVAVTPPLSARLEYKVLSQDSKQPNPLYGNATITWSTADGHYSVTLDATAKALFFNLDLLSSRSDGAIDGAGLAPERYTEKTRRRAMLATNFNRDTRQSVTFSASPVSVPLPPGVQDRLSILFQIGGLFLADPSRAAAGTRIEVPVANVRNDVEHWTFTDLGPETIASGTGPIATTHLQRTPKPGSNDRTLDLWVAADGGYPAQVRYTEPNGSTITMTLDRIGAVE